MGLFTKPGRKIASKKSKYFPKKLDEAEAFQVQFPIYYDGDAYLRNNLDRHMNNGHHVRFPHPDLFFAGEMQLKDATKFLDNKLYNPLKKRFVPSYRQLLQRQVFPDDDDDYRVRFRGKKKVSSYREDDEEGEVLKKLSTFKAKLARQESVSSESRAINREEMFSHLDQMVYAQDEGRNGGHHGDEAGSNLFFFKKKKAKKPRPVRRDQIKTMEDSIQKFADFDESDSDSDDDSDIGNSNNTGRNTQATMEGSWAIDLDAGKDPLARLRRRSSLKPSKGKVIKDKQGGDNILQKSIRALRSFRIGPGDSIEEGENEDSRRNISADLTMSRSDGSQSSSMRSSSSRHFARGESDFSRSGFLRDSFSIDLFPENSQDSSDGDSIMRESERMRKRFSGPTVKEVFGFQSGYDDRGRRWTHRLVQGDEEIQRAKEIAGDTLSVADKAHNYALDKMNGKPLDLDLIVVAQGDSFRTKLEGFLDVSDSNPLANKTEGVASNGDSGDHWAKPIQDEPDYQVPKITFTADCIEEASEEEDEEVDDFTAGGDTTDSLSTDPSVGTNFSIEDIEYKSQVSSVLHMIERSASMRRTSSEAFEMEHYDSEEENNTEADTRTKRSEEEEEDNEEELARRTGADEEWKEAASVEAIADEPEEVTSTLKDAVPTSIDEERAAEEFKETESEDECEVGGVSTASSVDQKGDESLPSENQQAFKETKSEDEYKIDSVSTASSVKMEGDDVIRNENQEEFKESKSEDEYKIDGVSTASSDKPRDDSMPHENVDDFKETKSDDEYKIDGGSTSSSVDLQGDSVPISNVGPGSKSSNVSGSSNGTATLRSALTSKEGSHLRASVGLLRIADLSSGTRVAAKRSSTVQTLKRPMRGSIGLNSKASIAAARSVASPDRSTASSGDDDIWA